MAYTRILCCCVALVCVALNQRQYFTSAEIPVRLAMKMCRITNADEFIKQFLSNNATLLTTTKAGIKPAEIVSNLATSLLLSDVGFTMAHQEICEPRDTVVPIPPDPDPTIFFWPTCVNITRCGGCCVNDAVDCAPSAQSNVIVQVTKNKLLDSNEVQYLGVVDITLESDVLCECQCRVQSTDCNATIQRYDADSCQCRCRNVTSCGARKQWDTSRCACTCPTIFNCLDDEYFNYSTCTCERFSNVKPIDANDNGVKSVLPEPTVTEKNTLCSEMHCRPSFQPIWQSGQCVCSPCEHHIRKRFVEPGVVAQDDVNST